MEYEVLVQLKGEVLDPEGRAIQHNLSHSGIEKIESISVSKRYVVKFNADTENAEQLIKKIASEYFANPVSQIFSIKRLT